MHRQQAPPLRLLTKEEIAFLEYQQHLVVIASRVYQQKIEPVVIDLGYDYELITVSKKRSYGKGRKKIEQTKALAVLRG